MKLSYYETDLLVEVLSDASSYCDREIENLKDDNGAIRIDVPGHVVAHITHKKDIAKRILKQIEMATVEW